MFEKLKIILSAHKQVLKLLKQKKINLADYRFHYARILTMARDFELSTSKYISDYINTLSHEEFETKLKEWQEAINLKRAEENWQDLYFSDKKFFSEYADFKYECTPELVRRRNEAYVQRFNIPNDCYIGHHVVFRCSHFIPNYTPALMIGHKVTMTENVFIDYTGRVILEDGVMLTNGVIIESHSQDLDIYKNDNSSVNTPSEIHISKNVYIGSRAVILASCHSIGENAVIGANAVVTKDVPANCLVAGAPAKVIKFYNK